MTIFGPMVAKHHVDQAVRAHLTTWLPDYLAEAARNDGKPPNWLPMIRSWRTVPSFVDKRPEDQLPCCILVSEGFPKPERDGDGLYSAWWSVEILVEVGGRDAETSGVLAGLYEVAVRTLMLQHPSLGGFADEVELTGAGWKHTPPNFAPVMAICEVDLNIHVPAIADDTQGPREPTSAPDFDQPTDWPHITDVEIETTRRSLT